ncbi:Uu.00g073700.m01.CDS01 [Anthostomella pinea]|uniref:Uu.00g073700.m01.CDS01 n=1 Tax=Anthostomella pinea TaxID=933095 RepID=A0AAI8VW77_9PEZI|nr:Uu.00g073700.m01.CDS01 [Anthostomella pinea]
MSNRESNLQPKPSVGGTVDESGDRVGRGGHGGGGGPSYLGGIAAAWEESGAHGAYSGDGIGNDNDNGRYEPMCYSSPKTDVAPPPPQAAGGYDHYGYDA